MKSDNDARGIAQMMRSLSPGPCEDAAQSEAADAADPPQAFASRAIAVVNNLRGTLCNFGLKVGMVGTAKFEARIRELVEDLPDLAVLVEPLLVVCGVRREQLGILHRRLLSIVRDDDVCRRLMTVPGVGPVVAMTYRATVDVPARFRNGLGANSEEARPASDIDTVGWI
jgi:transposase